MLLTIKVMIMESVLYMASAKSMALKSQAHLANPVLLRWRVQQIVAVTKSITKTHKLDHMVGNHCQTVRSVNVMQVETYNWDVAL
jgi:hypothetical protein